MQEDSLGLPFGHLSVLTLETMEVTTRDLSNTFLQIYAFSMSIVLLQGVKNGNQYLVTWFVPQIKKYIYCCYCLHSHIHIV